LSLSRSGKSVLEAEEFIQVVIAVAVMQSKYGVVAVAAAVAIARNGIWRSVAEQGSPLSMEAGISVTDSWQHYYPLLAVPLLHVDATRRHYGAAHR
jgi:hypothetical protein